MIKFAPLTITLCIMAKEEHGPDKRQGSVSQNSNQDTTPSLQVSMKACIRIAFEGLQLD